MKLVCDRWLGREEREQERRGYRIKNKNPTKMWGKDSFAKAEQEFALPMI